MVLRTACCFCKMPMCLRTLWVSYWLRRNVRTMTYKLNMQALVVHVKGHRSVSPLNKAWFGRDT